MALWVKRINSIGTISIGKDRSQAIVILIPHSYNQLQIIFNNFSFSSEVIVGG